MFKDWTKFEKLFLVLGTLTAIIFTIIFKSPIVDLIYALLYFWTALLLAKGKYACYIIGIISTFFYAFVSYSNQYYGEVIIAMCCTLPLMIIGLVNWLKHQDKKSTVIIKEISKKKILLLIMSQILMSFAYYYLLKIFNTNNLIISTISVAVSLIATYLAARRSEYGFVGFILNDIILIVLWSIPFIAGDANIATVLLCPILLLINDIYGVYNWKIIKQRQRRHQK